MCHLKQLYIFIFRFQDCFQSDVLMLSLPLGFPLTLVQCSTTCGMGAFWRHVECSSRNTSHCQDMKKPDPARRCYLRPCASWKTGNWSKVTSFRAVCEQYAYRFQWVWNSKYFIFKTIIYSVNTYMIPSWPFSTNSLISWPSYIWKHICCEFCSSCGGLCSLTLASRAKAGITAPVLWSWQGKAVHSCLWHLFNLCLQGHILIVRSSGKLGKGVVFYSPLSPCTFSWSVPHSCNF